MLITAGRSPSPTPSGARSAEMKLHHTKARRAEMLIREELSTWIAWRPTTRKSLCSGCIVYIIIKAGEMSNTAWKWLGLFKTPSTGKSWRRSKSKTSKGRFLWIGEVKWEVSGSRGCNAGDGGEETSKESMLNNVEQWRIHHLSKERGHKIDLGRRSPWWSERQEARPAGWFNNNMQPAGAAHYLHDHHLGVRWNHSRAWNWGSCLCAVGWPGSTIPHPVCQLLAGHPSSRREPWRSYYFAQHGGAWCQMEEGVAKSSNEWKSESFILCSFLLLWLSIFRFSAW